MNLFRRILTALLPALALSAGGCFTGVESTPRISDADVNRIQAAQLTPEQRFLTGIAPLPPSQWRPGRTWRVANDRISLIFTSASDRTDALAGHIISYEGENRALGLRGEDGVELIFRSDDGRRLFYRVPGMTRERFDTIPALDVPFTVDLDIVARLDSAMRGRTYFVRTPAWYTTATRQAVGGLRHIPVHIDSVGPGDENFPAAVYFTVTDPQYASILPAGATSYMVYMSLGDSKAATRNFDTIFAFDNPRRRYPEIKDDVWELIIRSRLRDGMTRDECRLALGAPPQVTRVPTYGGMVEQWTYTDGVYLYFEDGFLTRFRQ